MNNYFPNEIWAGWSEALPEGVQLFRGCPVVMYHGDKILFAPSGIGCYQFGPMLPPEMFPGIKIGDLRRIGVHFLDDKREIRR